MVTRNDEIDGAAAAILKGYLVIGTYDNYALEDLIAMARLSAGAAGLKNVTIRAVAAGRLWDSAPRTRPAPRAAVHTGAFHRSLAVLTPHQPTASR